MGNEVERKNWQERLPNAVLIITCVLVLICDVFISILLVTGSIMSSDCPGNRGLAFRLVLSIAMIAWGIIGCYGPVFWTKWGLRPTHERRDRKALAWALIILSPIIGVIVYIVIFGLWAALCPS